MAETDLTPEEVAADTAIPLYNGGAYDPATNPGGFDEDGHAVNLMPLARHVRVFGWLARRMALFARAQAVLTATDRALTAEDASNTYQDRLATAQSVLDAAGHVSKAGQWAGAAQNVEVEPGKFSALHWANRAFAAAAAVNLPVAAPGDALKFLQLKPDRSGYQLATIATATAQDVIDGTGTGFVTSTTFGQVFGTFGAQLQGQVTVALGALPPVGSLVAFPRFHGDPGPNYLSPRGQVVPLATYPKLATGLPKVSGQLLTARPYVSTKVLNVGSTGSGEFAPLSWIVAKGNRFAIGQAEFLRYFENGALLRSVGAAANGTVYGTPVLRDVDVVQLSADRIEHVQIGATNFGQKTTAIGVPNYGSGSKDNLFELPNGSLLAVKLANGGPDRYRVCRLPAGTGNTAWSALTLPVPIGGGEILADHLSWQDKAGRVYLAGRLATNQQFSILRTTDGATWQNLGLLNVPTYVDLPEMYFANWKTSDRAMPLRYLESPDGTQMVIRAGGYGFLVSSNSGATWRMLDRVDIRPEWEDGQGYTESMQMAWDAERSRWIFGYVRPTSAAPYFLTLRLAWSTDLVSFTSLFNGNNGGALGARSGGVKPRGLLAFKNSIKLFASAEEGESWVWNYNVGTGAATRENADKPRRLLLGLDFDGHVFSTGTPNDSGTINGVRWVRSDESSDVVQRLDTNNTSYNIDWPVISGNFVASRTSATISHGIVYDYNPDTERKLPNIQSYYNPGSSNSIFDIAQNGQSYPFDWFLKVN